MLSSALCNTFSSRKFSKYLPGSKLLSRFKQKQYRMSSTVWCRKKFTNSQKRELSRHFRGITINSKWYGYVGRIRAWDSAASRECIKIRREVALWTGTLVNTHFCYSYPVVERPGLGEKLPGIGWPIEKGPRNSFYGMLIKDRTG